MPIIALSGKLQVGKDTFGNILVKDYGYKRVAFGDALKVFCSKVTGLHESYFFDNELKDKEFDRPFVLDFHHIDKMREILINEFGYEVNYETREMLEDFESSKFTTPRHILRTIGTDMVRKHVDDQIWISKALDDIKEAGGKVVITDCRFPLERELMRKIGAILVKIKRNDNGSSVEHEFDLGPDEEYDVVFDNSYSLQEYTSNIKTWYSLRRAELEFQYNPKYEE